MSSIDIGEELKFVLWYALGIGVAVTGALGAFAIGKVWFSLLFAVAVIPLIVRGDKSYQRVMAYIKNLEDKKE